MFDIGFSELVVCAIVALVVIGPERMPEAVRTIGLWVGRLKRSLRETRSELERQMGMDDIRRQLHNEDIMRSLEEARKDINDVIAQSQNSIHPATSDEHYKSEPELPYHSHTDEKKPGDAPSEASNASDSATQTIPAATDTHKPS